MKEIKPGYLYIQKGDWLFTCTMKPEQFKEWENDRYDGFLTLNGSSHARAGCSLQPISAVYARWFIDHKLWELFPGSEVKDRWGIYEEKIKNLAEEAGLDYEGV